MYLLALSIAPGLAIAIYIYWKDKFEKEPLHLLFLSFLLGIAATIPAILLEWLVDKLGLGSSDNNFIIGLYSFAGIALVEEACKFFFVYRFLFHKKAFNEPFDGITYAVMVSMGFATLENVAYTFNGGLSVGVMRMFTAVPAHAVFGVVMGYFMGLAKFWPSDSNRYIGFAVLIPTLLHGLYDFSILQNGFPELRFIGAVLSLILGIILSRKAMKIHQHKSPFKPKE
ncbi:MAG: RsiW-degrading membrane proteinase PrsW (M82 family) [Bacteroidia bacterium]|jgi:RsiW-degrading membrane proteinase PrsW (M82 family)